MATTRKRSSEQALPSSKKTKSESNGSNEISIGELIPDVTVPDQDGNAVSLRDIKGVLVLFSYPKASTPGCTRQTRGFGEKYAEFAKLNATVYGLSADSEKAQTTFKTKLGLPFNLLSDTKYELLGPLGGKKSPKGVIRSHWVFVDGKLVFVEHGVKPDASPLDSLEVVKSQGASEPKTGTNSEDGPDTESKSEDRPDTESKSEDVPEADSKREDGPDTESKSEDGPEADSKQEDGPDTESKSEDVPDGRSNSETRPKSESEVNPKPENDAPTETNRQN